MFRVSGVRKEIADRVLFDAVSFNLNPRERIALVGPNGSGKSTLLRVLAGIDEADAGSVHHGDTIRYLPQQCTTSGAVADFLVETHQDLHAVKKHLDISGIDLTRPLSELSGGQLGKLALVSVLLEPSDILLLDEPTNNLDIQALEWLEQTLLRHPAGMIVVSHDRRFLDRVTTRTLELDPLTSRLTEYGGNYSWYRERKRQEHHRQELEFKEQQRRIARLQSDIADVKSQALKTELTTVNDYLRGRSKKVAAKAKARESRLNKMLSAENKIEKPRALETVRIDFDVPPLHRTILISASNASVGYKDFTILNSVNLNIESQTRVAIVGRNGGGKTTLLKLLLGELPPLTGTIQRPGGLKIGYLPQDQQFPCEMTTVLRFFDDSLKQQIWSESEMRTFLHRFLFSRDDVFKQIRVLSHGERMRLRFAAIMASQPDLLVLDEPTNHLDLATLESLENALSTYKGTIIAVTHDRYFIDELAPHIVFHIENGTVREEIQSQQSMV
jgi:ATP-binding cassette, subfamily F, member 3